MVALTWQHRTYHGLPLHSLISAAARQIAEAAALAVADVGRARDFFESLEAGSTMQGIIYIYIYIYIVVVR